MTENLPKITTMAPILAAEKDLLLKKILTHFPTPFFLYSEAAIRHQCQLLNKAFADLPGGYRNYGAVKANPNKVIQGIHYSEGCGADCSSTSELIIAKELGLTGEDIFFTSNNTGKEEFDMAFGMNTIFNFDDLALERKKPKIPKIACARYNPGLLVTTAGNFVGKPEDSKYGMDVFQIMDFYRKMKIMGVKRFMIHTMICSNERDYRKHVATLEMLLKLVSWLSRTLNIKFEVVNAGGGFGVAYNPETDNHLNLEALASGVKKLLEDFHREHGWSPKYVTENGRFLTASAGILVASVINIKQNMFRTCVGLDTSTYSSVPRPFLYDAFHEVTFLRKNPMEGERICDVVGALCENADKFATNRLIPIVNEGDLAFIHNGGAHCSAMAGTYNGRRKPGSVMIFQDGTFGLIQEPQTDQDLFTGMIMPSDVKRISMQMH